MTADQIAAAVERGANFDAFLESALRERHGDAAHWLVSASPTFDTVSFVDAIRTAGYQPERIPRLVAMLNDLKLQHYFLLFEVLTLYPTAADTPAARLREAAVDQMYIVMTRVFFERFMNLVYYLERGEELRARSRKAAFFRMVDGSERWGWMKGLRR